MRFVSVTARAFGALRDATLELAPGFNVIYGANGAGKSTWHAALYAALCGMRRGPGRRREDRDFAAEWSPRTGSEWLVRARIVLADGRTIELRQDLEHLVDCRATDVDLSLDVSSEIMNENTPDGARWLGLDRQAFLATACVRQADLLVVLDDASRLQEHLQRAAASAGRDETAAAALQRIEQFQREHVGLDRANSTRPLRRAKEREQAARAAFDQAAESMLEGQLRRRGSASRSGA